MGETQVAGQLPRPVSQNMLMKDRFSWQWLPLGENNITIRAYFVRSDKNWTVELFSPTGILFFLEAEDARLVGEALLAAYNWQFIWKEHFVDYMLEQDDIENEINV